MAGEEHRTHVRLLLFDEGPGPSAACARGGLVSGAAVPRVTLSREEAAASLGLSLDTFKRRVLPDLPVVYVGRRRLIRVVDLERWAERHVTAPVRETITGSRSRTGSGAA